MDWLDRAAHGASIGAGIGALGLGIGALPGAIVGAALAVGVGALDDRRAQRAALSTLPGNTLPLPDVEIEPVIQPSAGS